MAFLKPLSLVSNLFKGYTLSEAMDLTVEAGFTHIEPASILNMCEHFTADELDEEFAAEFIEKLHEKKLSCHAVSGHVDLTDDKQCDDFLKKIEFAGRIGANIINTNSGPVKYKDIFFKKMNKVISEAERWNVIIGLESHGDIISSAKESVYIFKHFNHPLVRFNYDTGNTYFYSNGTIQIEEDIKYGMEYMSYLHLKDIRIRDKKVEYRALGEGDINLEEVLNNLKTNFRNLPCGLEIPVHVKGVLMDIKPVGTPLPKEEIFIAINISLDFLRE